MGCSNAQRRRQIEKEDGQIKVACAAEERAAQSRLIQ